MATFVLVAGGGHGAWCWKYVVPLLEAAGHRVTTPELQGLGADKTPMKDVRFEDWIARVADVIRAEREPVILVGHSRGGMVITQTAEEVPERIRKLVYLSALLLPSGLAAADSMSVHKVAQTRAFTLRPTADGLAVAFDPQELASELYGTTSPARVREAQELVRAEPLVGLKTPLRTSEARFGRVPRVFIELTRDRALFPAVQRAFQDAMPCQQRYTLDTDHSPFFSDPEGLAGVFNQIAAN